MSVNVSFLRQVKTNENGTKILGDSAKNGGFSLTLKKGLDGAGGNFTAEGSATIQKNLTLGTDGTNSHTIRGTTTFGAGTTISIDDGGNILIGGEIRSTATDGYVKIGNAYRFKLPVRGSGGTTIGEIFVDSSDGNKLKYYDGTAVRTLQHSGSFTFNAKREKVAVDATNQGKTSVTLSDTPIGADVTERRDMVQVYLNGLFLEESSITSSDSVTNNDPDYSFQISNIPSGESITPYSLTFEIPYTSSTGNHVLRGKDNGTGSIVDNGSDTGAGTVQISTGTVNYSDGSVSFTVSATGVITSIGSAASIYSVADYIYNDSPTTSVDVFGTVAGDKILVWYLTA
jgi:hypothetical protein